MFTGIVEELGKVKALNSVENNLNICVEAKFTSELKIDQSVSHNGVCLTVVEINNTNYTVTAIEETLLKTNLSSLKVNDYVNLERGMVINARLDGHIVQGHVDQVGTCVSIEHKNGSWEYGFTYNANKGNVTIEKGSITINGVSLTVFKSEVNAFSVAIIPYTYKNTTFKLLSVGDTVNLEFDVIGKYVKRLLKL